MKIMSVHMASEVYLFYLGAAYSCSWTLLWPRGVRLPCLELEGLRVYAYQLRGYGRMFCREWQCVDDPGVCWAQGSVPWGLWV